MRPIVDGIIFSLQRHGGITVYFRELLHRLVRDGHPATLLLHPPLMQEASGLMHEDSMRTTRTRPLERYRHCQVPAGADLFHSSYYRLPDRPLPTVVTVHDFVYERHVHGPRRWVHQAQKRRAIQAAQVIICISQSTRDDLLELVGVRSDQRVYVIHNGVGEAFRQLRIDKPSQPFILFVGQRAGYKNFALVLNALEKLPDVELHCVGGGVLHPAELTNASTAARSRVRHVGHTSEAELNRLYNQALCLVYPSSYEGFGIPVAEAMRAGCPVVSVACKAVLEVGRHALTVALEPSGAALAIAIRALAAPEYRRQMIASGLHIAQCYSWERTYRQTLEVYRSLHSGDSMDVNHPR